MGARVLPGAVSWKWNSAVGEPIGATIHSIDITVICGNPLKLSDKPYSTLPCITREWFTNNKNK